MQWVEQFIKMGGFDFICKLLFQSDMTKEQNQRKKEDSDDISRSTRVLCEAFLLQVISLLLQMDRLFLHVVPPSNKATVAVGAITGLKNSHTFQEKLTQRSLKVSQRILVWARVTVNGANLEEDEPAVNYQGDHVQGYKVMKQMTNKKNTYG